MSRSRPPIHRACAMYVHRFTMEHVPAWALKRREDGTYYAPQYRSDAEWYANTTFPGEPGHHGNCKHCLSTGATWPLGTALQHPFPHKAQARHAQAERDIARAERDHDEAMHQATRDDY